MGYLKIGEIRVKNAFIKALNKTFENFKPHNSKTRGFRHFSLRIRVQKPKIPTLLADAGVDITTIKRHAGWKSTTVAEGYVENSIENKTKIANQVLVGTTTSAITKTVNVSEITYTASFLLYLDSEFPLSPKYIALVESGPLRATLHAAIVSNSIRSVVNYG
ncbi:hypothetical protein NQ317_005251 [Molorchus minor]|uniref:Uncharacterized protein n=1 Tax=Molorchus minor TaxID=1323400 RepID=A0ABQ9JX65_9CUCU|nr:hypothetical protein NQ317_005251 [Molorchus minor]